MSDRSGDQKTIKESIMETFKMSDSDNKDRQEESRHFDKKSEHQDDHDDQDDMNDFEGLRADRRASLETAFKHNMDTFNS